MLTPNIYWELLSDSPTPAFYSGRDSPKEHAQMQWLFQGAMVHLTLQQQCVRNDHSRANFQSKVQGTDHRIYSPIGFYMDENDFDYLEECSYIPTFFPEDGWLRELVSRQIGWALTDDQAIMLMHLEVIHDWYPPYQTPVQFDHVATHFALYYRRSETHSTHCTEPRTTYNPGRFSYTPQ